MQYYFGYVLCMGQFWVDYVDVDGMLFLDMVVGQQGFVFVDMFGEFDGEVFEEIEQ